MFKKFDNDENSLTNSETAFYEPQWPMFDLHLCWEGTWPQSHDFPEQPCTAVWTHFAIVHSQKHLVVLAIVQPPLVQLKENIGVRQIIRLAESRFATRDLGVASQASREINVYLKSFASLSCMHLTSDEFHTRKDKREIRERKRDRKMRMCVCLPREAMCNAVFPFLVAASTIAPRFRSSLTISKWPSLAARCKAFKPFCNIKSVYR